MFKKFAALFMWLLVVMVAGGKLSAADIRSLGVPYVQNYSKAQYQSGNQNWSVAKDKRGVMYFGNSEGLLTFDGRFWQQYQMPNKIIVRSVATDDEGRVYTGGFAEFGYWDYNSKGRLAYHSLTSLIPEKFGITDEVWKIYADKGKVYFQSFSSIFIYQNGKISVVRADQPFLFLFKAGARYFTEVIGKGLFELRGERLHYIRGSEVLGNTGVLSVLPYRNGQYIIGTAKNGLFIYDGRTVSRWQNQADELLKTYQLNNGALVLGRYLAFGTILNGIVILDAEGRVVQKIDKSSGLQNNTVLALFSDEAHSLWTGLDNGIDRIELNSPLYFYFDKKGSLGTVYSSIIHQDKIYLGTNQGLYYSDLRPLRDNPFHEFDFKLIAGTQGQVWDLSLINGQLLCGHNNGTFLVEGTSVRNISLQNGGWVIRRLSPGSEHLIQGTYTGLVIYKKDGQGAWVFSHRVDGFGEPSRYVEQDEKGNIWVAHAYKGIYKLKLSADLRRVVSSQFYLSRNGLPQSFNINVFKLEGQVVFSSDSGFYLYDHISDRFSKYAQLNKLLGSFASSNKLIPAMGKQYWFINHGRVALANFYEPGKVSVDSTRFTMLNGRMVQYYENISRISNATYLISIDEGFAIYKGEGKPDAARVKIPAVLIRKVENITDSIFSITENAGAADMELPYSKNSIRITYSLPYYRQAEVKYQYLLEGYAERWSAWSTQAVKDFTNLDPGSYTFKVRASVNGKELSGVSEFKFEVLPPWYLSKWAILFYILLHIAAFFVLRRLYFLKLKKHQEKIQLEMQKEKEEQLRREALANEQKIIELKNKQLQTELESKSRELANSAMNIVYKNELLAKLRDEIDGLKDSRGQRLGGEQLKRLQKVIEEGLTDERDWNLFEKSFNEAHENFFKKLKTRYPDLVPNDLKLCAYLRMNMSSKEIASLLNISLRGVEIRRYRLRKKLSLDHEKNLVEFFMEL